MNRSNSDIVKKQFNKQAEHFNQWAVTKNSAYLKAITEFIAPAPCDTLLDVACGTGELTLFMAPQLKSAMGIDIADRMIEKALPEGRSHNSICRYQRRLIWIKPHERS